MDNIITKIVNKNSIIISLLGVLLIAGCSSPPKTSDLGGIYNELAQHEDPYRNPIVLIPGILGSKLIDPDSAELAWGTFGFRRQNPTTPEGARLISPVKWTQVIFLFSDHRNITKDAAFTDNLLYILLESP